MSAATLLASVASVVAQGMPPANTLVWVRHDVSVNDGSAVPPGSGFFVPRGSGVLFLRLDGPNPVPLPPGTFPIFVSPAEGYFVQTASLAGTDLLHAPVSVSLGEDPGTLRVVLTRTRPDNSPLATIVGTVANQPGVEIELVPLTGRTWSSGPEYAVVGADGRFRIEGVEPGIYDVNLTPAMRVARVIALAGETTLTIDAPPGNLFGGGTRVVDVLGERVSAWPATDPTLVFERNGERTSVPIARTGVWGALMPGEYRVTLTDLEPGFTLRALQAGSVDLLERPLLVPIGRSPEAIYVELLRE